MAFRFWRRKKIAPGLSLNLSKRGASLSFGPKGAKFTVGPRGTRGTVGIPGTGLFYTSKLSSSRPAKRSSSRLREVVPVVPPESRLTLGFFKRLTTPEHERHFVDGCKELVLGKEEEALKYLRGAVHLVDGAFLAGFLTLKRERFDEAEQYLKVAAERSDELGRYFSKYGISASMSLPVTSEIQAHIDADLRGVLLGLVEIYQRQERWQDALHCLKNLQEIQQDDVVVRVSLAELLMEALPGDKDACQEVVRLSEGIENESPVHSTLLLYKAKALHGLGVLEAAKDVISEALRKKKDRSEDLLRALRYERGLIYESMGQEKRAAAEFGKLYAEAPDYRDVAKRLGI